MQNPITSFKRTGLRLAVAAAALGSLSAAASASTDYLSVVVEAPWWLEFQVQVFYVGANQPICSFNLMGGQELNVSMLTKPFFIRAWGVSSNRTDQTKTLTFTDPTKPGIAAIYPGQAYLAPWLSNITSH